MTNSAKPAMMVRMSLPLAVSWSKLKPVSARTLTLAVQVVKGLHQALGAAAPAVNGVNLAGLRQGEDLFAFRGVILHPTRSR
jgi:hypothetical protein